MGFRRGQKEHKYITEFDSDVIENVNETAPSEPEKQPETKPIDPYEESVVELPEIDPIPDMPIITEAPKTVAEPKTEIPRERPLVEKEKNMVNDFKMNQTGSLQMKVARPRSLREATAVADSLMAGQTIVLNLDALSDIDGRRMMDYIAGIIYAISGKIERPSERTFLLTPDGVYVATEEKNEENA